MKPILGPLRLFVFLHFILMKIKHIFLYNSKNRNAKKKFQYNNAKKYIF